MATQLSFSQDGSLYKASFVSAGKTTVQIERDYNLYDNRGALIVYAYIDGMNRTPIKNWSKNNASPNMIFQIDVPAGVNIDIVSDCNVTSANYITEGI